MNLLVFNPADVKNGHLVVSGHQHAQIKNVLKCKAGDSLKVGALNGNIGSAKVIEVRADSTLLEIQTLSTAPPPCLNLALIVALPRPQMIKRILQTVATLGVKTVYFIQSSRVEKSYWQSPVLQTEEIHRQLVLGLEQGAATQYPRVELHPRFIPFMQDVLPGVSENARCFIAEPGPHPQLRETPKGAHNILAIGPEGGFIDKELAFFREAGFTAVSLGDRILKVETAVTVAAAAF